MVPNMLQCYRLASFSHICEKNSAAIEIPNALFQLDYCSLYTMFGCSLLQKGKNAWPNIEPVYKGVGESIKGQDTWTCQHKLSVSISLDNSLAISMESVI